MGRMAWCAVAIALATASAAKAQEVPTVEEPKAEAPKPPEPPEPAKEATPAPATEAATPEQATADAAAAAERALEAARAARDAAEAARSAAAAAREASGAVVEVLETEKAKPKAAEKPSPWGAQVGLAVISVAGNANAVSSKANVAVTGSWAHWDAELDLLGAYGQSTDETGGITVTAYNGEVRLRGNRKLGPKLQVYLLGGVATDHVASLQLQAFGEAGVGVTWFEEKEPSEDGEFVRTALRTDLGFRGTHERWYQYYPVGMDLPDRTLYALRLAADFRYALSKTTLFTERAEVLPDLLDAADLRVKSITAVSVQIVEGLSISLSFNVRYIGQPAEDRKPTDTELSAGLTLAI